jgi:hypothetical protein
VKTNLIVTKIFDNSTQDRIQISGRANNVATLLAAIDDRDRKVILFADPQAIRDLHKATGIRVAELVAAGHLEAEQDTIIIPRDLAESCLKLMTDATCIALDADLENVDKLPGCRAIVEQFGELLEASK